MKPRLVLGAVALLAPLAMSDLARATADNSAETGLCLNSNLPCRTLTAQPTYTPLPYDSQYSSGSPAVATLSVSQPVETGTSPLLAPATGITSADAFAAANSSGVHASATASTQAFVPANDFAFDPLSGGIGQGSTDMIAAYALATRTIYDVVITGPSTPSGVISAALNLRLDGTLDNDPVALGGNSPFAAVENDLQILVYVNGTTATGSYHETGIATSSGTNAPSITTSGLLNGFGTSGGHISTPTLNLPIGRPFTIALDMLVQTRAVEQASSGSTDANVVAHGVTDFGNTFGFDTLGPVFSFSDAGYTASSVDGGFMNNTVVPEPGSLLLLSLGLTGLVAVPARARRNRGSGGGGWIRTSDTRLMKPLL